MTEYERIREKMILLAKQCYSQELSACSNHPIFQPQKFIDLILPLVEIRAANQSLPSVRNAVNKSYNDYMLGQEDMLKAGFVKVAPKPNV